MTQTERVLSMLREAGDYGVCSEEFYASYLPHARNRIAEDLPKRGFVIARGPCKEHDHNYFRYSIAVDPERPVQMRLVS